MSEEYKKTAEETQVDLEVKRSEVRKNEAEARKVEAEASKAEAEAREAEIKAYDAELSFRKRQSDDERNHLYRVDGEVSTSSVKKCMTKDKVFMKSYLLLKLLVVVGLEEIKKQKKRHLS